eukprot:14239643-Alexandrium_andersonii.AAC.1
MGPKENLDGKSRNPPRAAGEKPADGSKPPERRWWSQEKWDQWKREQAERWQQADTCLLYTSPSPRD